MSAKGGLEAGALPPGVMEDRSDRAKVEIEREAGLRCIGCGDRIATGFEFTVGRALMRVGDLAGPRKVEVGTFYTCAGSERCDAMLGLTENRDVVAVRVIEPNEILYMDDPRTRALLTRVMTAAGGKAPAADEVPTSRLERDADTGLPILRPEASTDGR